MILQKDYFSPSVDKEKINGLSSLALAHVGDAAFELMVRTYLIEKGRATAAHLHSETIKLVNARAQAEFAAKLLPVLTQDESDVYRRGRNARVNSVPKHMEVSDYHSATGFEALFGWLWLCGERMRLNELFNIIINK